MRKQKLRGGKELWIWISIIVILLILIFTIIVLSVNSDIGSPIVDKDEFKPSFLEMYTHYATRIIGFILYHRVYSVLVVIICWVGLSLIKIRMDFNKQRKE